MSTIRDWSSRILGTQRKFFNFFLFFVIIVVNLSVFYPSFFHCARSDQITYLIATAHLERLPELIASYSYPRHGTIDAGEDFLFRPVFYIFLAIEKWMFGLDFMRWQVTGVLLHLLLLWRLLKVLELIRPGFWPWLFVLNFSVLYLSQEMVIWHHINAYILFAVFLLQGFYHFIKYLREQAEGKEKYRRIGLTVCYLTLACLTYEFGVVCTLVLALGAWIYRCQEKKMPMVLSRKIFSETLYLISPVVIYGCLYLIDWAQTGFAMMVSMKNYTSGFDIKDLFGCWSFFVNFSFFSTFWFNHFLILPRERLVMSFDLSRQAEALWDLYLIFFTKINVVLLVMAILVFCFVICRFRGKNIFKSTLERDQPRKTAIPPIGLLAIVMFLLYALLLGVRASLHSPNYHLISLYGFYILSLMWTIGGYCLFSVYLNPVVNRSKTLEHLLILVFCLSIFLNATRTYRLNLQMKGLYNPWRIAFLRLDEFVKNHQVEKDFSYKFVWQERVSFFKFTIKTMPGKKFVAKTADLLFPKYLKDPPKYYLLYFDREGIVPFLSEAQANAYLDPKLRKEK